MHKKSVNEFFVSYSNSSSWIARLLSSGRKRNLSIIYGKDTAVGYGDFMSVFSKILDSIAKTVKGLFDIRTPFFCV